MYEASSYKSHRIECATSPGVPPRFIGMEIGKSIDSIWFTGGGVHFRINKSRPDIVALAHRYLGYLPVIIATRSLSTKRPCRLVETLIQIIPHVVTSRRIALYGRAYRQFDPSKHARRSP